MKNDYLKFGELCEAIISREIIECFDKHNCFVDWSKVLYEKDSFWELRKMHEAYWFRLKKQKKKLYKWAYKTKNTNAWIEHPEFVEKKEDARPIVSDDPIEWKRLDYAMIEVD